MKRQLIRNGSADPARPFGKSRQCVLFKLSILQSALVGVTTRKC